METMKITEKKKSSKGAIISLLLFFIIGGGIIYFAISTEKEPTVLGNQSTDIQRLVDVEKTDKDAIIEKNKNISYEVKTNKDTDTSNKKMKSNMSLPAIFINGEELSDINKEIDKDYTEMFNSLKEKMATADSNYTYTVTHNVYENFVDTKRVISITIYERITDDLAKKNTMEKLKTYNIDLATKKTISETEVAQILFDKDYKSKIKDSVKEYVVSKNMISESNFTYAVTGLENYYIKDSKFHIIFNEGELANAKYGVLDITVE